MPTMGVPTAAARCSGPVSPEITNRACPTSATMSATVVWGARRAPQTAIADIVALVGRARLVVSGDTGPLHLAAAVGAPIVGIYGPTDPARNGPVSPDDVCVSRHDVCECSHLRRCRAARWCLETVTVDEVMRAVDRRLARVGAEGGDPGAEARGERGEAR